MGWHNILYRDLFRWQIEADKIKNLLYTHVSEHFVHGTVLRVQAVARKAGMSTPTHEAI